MSARSGAPRSEPAGRRWAAVGLAVILTGSLTMATAAITPPQVAAADCPTGWQPMSIDPALGVGVATGSASVAGASAWIVGRSNSLAMLGSWDGTAWRSVPPPWAGDSGLTGVSALSSTAAWTVGFRRLYSPLPIAARWNGTSWVDMAPPRPGGRSATLTDVAAIAPKKAFAVGLRLAGGRLRPVAQMRLKSGWVDRSPDFGTGSEGGLAAVSRAPNGRIWAVGWRSDDGSPRPWVGVWYAGAWYPLPAADPGPGLGYLTDVEFRSSSEGWTVGYLERGGGGYAPVLQRWTGSQWVAESLPWDDSVSVVLTTVAVDGLGALVVGGQRMSDAGASAVMAILRDGTWQVSPPRNDPYPGSWTQSVTGLGAGAIAVGYFDRAGRVFVTCDDGAESPPTAGEPPGSGYDESDATNFEEDLPPPSSLASSSGRSPAVSADGDAAANLEGFVARDVTAAAGLTMRTRTYGGIVADFNTDTWPDIWINRHGADVPNLALGSESGFTPADATFQFTDRHRCAVADANGDDGLDLFCTVGRRQGTAMGAHEFLLNVGETGGTMAAEEFGLLDVTGRGHAAAFVRLGGDPLPSLFISNEPVRIDGLPSFNRFYRNDGGTRFVPASALGLDASSGGVCAVAVNLDGDADDELLVCTSEPAGGLAAGLRLFDFDGTRFVDRTLSSGLAPISDLDVAVADFNGDGLPDLAQLRPNRLRVSLASADGRYVRSIQLDTSRANALATGDVNADGRADIYLLRNGPDVMLVNDGDGTAFVSVEIPQPGGSADDVIGLDYDRNGLSDFLVLNGLYAEGPVKLTAFFSTEE